MASEDDEQSPFTRPGFVASTVVVFLLVVGGVGVAVFGGDKDEPPAQPEPTATVEAPDPEPEPPSEAAQDSVCGLNGETVEEARLTSAPAAEWDYQGVMAYPSSEEFGPGATSDEGYRYCFQRSPEGVVFAAANAVVQASDLEIMVEWLNYFVADTPEGKGWVRDEVTDDGSLAGSRSAVEGFRLLEYDGTRARVDMASSVTVEGQTHYISIIYPLVWEDGDWKLEVTDADAPTDVAQLPDLAGYIAWGE